MNQAHTCKTIGVVTKPVSTHALMHPRSIIHARTRARGDAIILATTPSAFRRCAGRGREYESRMHVT